MLDKIKECLNSNPYLTDDIKVNITDLIEIFNEQFPNVDLTNLCEKLKTLQIEKGSKFVVRGLSQYNPIENKILISLSQIDDDADCKHLLMRELLNVITSKDNFTGFNNDNKYEALNIGYTEILANLLVGTESICEYEDEVIAANLMISLIGDENVFNAYFKNDINLIIGAVS